MSRAASFFAGRKRAALAAIAVPIIAAGLLSACSPQPDGSIVYHGSCAATDGVNAYPFAVKYYRLSNTQTMGGIVVAGGDVGGMQPGASAQFVPTDTSAATLPIFFWNAPKIVLDTVHPEAPSPGVTVDPSHGPITNGKYSLWITGGGPVAVCTFTLV